MTNLDLNCIMTCLDLITTFGYFQVCRPLRGLGPQPPLLSLLLHVPFARHAVAARVDRGARSGDTVHPGVDLERRQRRLDLDEELQEANHETDGQPRAKSVCQPADPGCPDPRA